MSKTGVNSNSDAVSFDSLEEKFKAMHIDAALQRSEQARQRRSELPKDYNHHDTEEYYHLEGVADGLTAQLLEVKQRLAYEQRLAEEQKLLEEKLAQLKVSSNPQPSDPVSPSTSVPQ